MDISVEPQTLVRNFRTVGGLAASALLAAPAKSPYTAHVARKHLIHSLKPEAPIQSNLQRYLSMVHHRWTTKPFSSIPSPVLLQTSHPIVLHH